jgi:hypothetical protein
VEEIFFSPEHPAAPAMQTLANKSQLFFAILLLFPLFFLYEYVGKYSSLPASPPTLIEVAG